MRRCFAFALCTSMLAAQPVVIPSSAAAADANTLDREPFGHESLRHITYIHRDLLTALPWQAPINRIAYRRDVTVPLPVLRRPPGIWQVRMGNYQGSVAQPPSAWPGLTDPNWSVVFQPRQISFPDLPQPGGSGPAPFQLQFWLDRPFLYAGNHLGIEHFVADSLSLHDYFIDAIDGLVPGGSVDQVPGSMGCPAGENRTLGQAPNPGGGNLEMYLFGAVPQSNVALALGASNVVWGGQSLPLSLSYAGLNGCSVYVSMDSMWSARTSSAGVAELSFPVPGQSGLLGARFFGQWLCGDARMSQAVPLTLSDAAYIRLGTNLNSSSIGMSVVSAFSGSNQYGYVQPNRGPVVELNW